MELNNNFLILYSQQLDLAFQGYGIDYLAIANVLQNISPDQIERFSKAFYCYSQQSLSNYLKQRCGGKGQNLMQYCIQDRYTLWATLIKKSIKGLGTDEKMLTELLILASEEDMVLIQEKYFEIYDKEMLEDISSDFSKNAMLKFLKAWVYAMRYPKQYIIEEVELLKTTLAAKSVDQQIIIKFLTTITPEQFREINDLYLQNAKQTIKQAMIKAFTGKIQYAIVMGVEFLISGTQACAFAFSKSLKSKEQSILCITALLRDRYRSQFSQIYSQVAGKTLEEDLKIGFEDISDTIITLWN
ncbi:Annexin 8 [Spironucleus salmonicida]|uniref:Annexin 8 n=1 Tax=Spironucleus salmonicida TaxID=348837 RepID=V6LE86_9EUKA|nr:Annexin 8 [Spironucleus salmonicida]|eukprot:EST42006.1 Annexin 8 [Spironucleus salmonicida]